MNQPQTEAFLSLVIFSIFADTKLSLREGDALNKVICALDWHSHHPKEIFLLTTMSRARAATNSIAASHAFITDKSALFIEAEDQKKLLDALQTILVSDGLVEVESEFLEKVRTALPDGSFLVE